MSRERPPLVGVGVEQCVAVEQQRPERRVLDGLTVAAPCAGSWVSQTARTHAFLPLLRRFEHPRLVMVSSGVGSFGIITDPDRIESSLNGLVYPSSKAALNTVASMYATSLTDARVTAVDPGYTATELDGHSGTQTVAEGVEAIVEACSADTVAAGFIDRGGSHSLVRLPPAPRTASNEP